MITNSFFSAFSYQGLQVIDQELNHRAEMAAAADKEHEMPKIAELTNVWYRIAQVFTDIMKGLPGLGQLSGIAAIVDGVTLLRGEDGWHSAGKGMIVRGVIQILNLGVLLLPVDILGSICEWNNHRQRGRSACRAYPI